ncbi:MAG: glycosyltransferase family 9 protein [Bacteroidota bacterium]
MKILLIALSGIGDALMFTPSLEKLKEKFPSSQIDSLVMFKGVQDIFSSLPEISTIHYWDFLQQNKFASLKFVLTLRKQYDCTINVYPSNRKEYNLISWLIGAEKRLAVKYLRKDFSNLGFLNNIRIEENDNLHNVEENIRMCEKLIDKKIDEIPPLKFNLEKEDYKYAKEFLRKNESAKGGDEKDLVIGFHAGCSSLKNHDKRRWEPKKFTELGKKLIDEFGAKILVFGGSDEEMLKDSIVANINSPNARSVNVFSLSSTAAVMKRCNLFITNDSSLMHVAAALKLNIVAIIGPTNKNYIYPWHTNYKIVSLNLECSPCFYYSPKPLLCSRNDVKFKCIKELSVDMVLEKAKEFLT